MVSPTFMEWNSPALLPVDMVSGGFAADAAAAADGMGFLTLRADSGPVREVEGLDRLLDSTCPVVVALSFERPSSATDREVRILSPLRSAPPAAGALSGNHTFYEHRGRGALECVINAPPPTGHYSYSIFS